MKKNNRFAVLICILLLLCIFAAACCVDDSDDKDKEDTIVLEYLDHNSIIKWSANWADKFSLIVYFGENTDGTLIYSENDINGADNHRILGGYFTQSGKHFAVLLAFKSTVVKRETLVFDVTVEYEEPGLDDEYQDPSSEVPEGFKKDIGKLKSVYYHVAKSESNLSINLANQNGVKSVSGFTLSQYGDWKYNEDINALEIDSVYLNKFSLGARLAFDVEYVDGREDRINVQLVDELPMDIIKSGLINSPIYSNNTNGVISLLNLAVNYDIYLGYDSKPSSDGSSAYVKDVSIDGKKLQASSYLCYSKESKITLTANKSLSGLSYGMHLLEIYTTHGKSEVWLNVRGSNTYPINVSVDYDSSYPNIFVRWSMLRDDAEEFVVKIGDREYSDKNYPDLFDGYKFDATDKIAYGEEVRITAVIGGKTETSLSATLDIDISNPAIQGYLSYDDGFEYLGTRYNTFIKDYNELKDLIFYALIHYGDVPRSKEAEFEKTLRVYVNPTLASNAKDLQDRINSAVEYFNEGVKYKLQVKGGYINIYEINFTIFSTCIPGDVVRSSSIKESAYNDTHFSEIGRNDDFDGFAVNGFEKTAEVTYSEEVYLALERGIRPIPKQDSPAQVVYEKAKTILRRIIDDNMNDFQKVHAIADWLSVNVTYNRALADELGKVSPSNDDYNKYYAYRELFLEGAILDGLAVCNGYAKAVSLLCGIEGIKCYKIKGASGKGSGAWPNREYPQHAWNKVCIDGSWYVVDCTWANERYPNDDSSATREVHKHNTLFMSDDQSGNYPDGGHYETYPGDYSGYYAGCAYDVFANTFFWYDGNVYDMVIDSKEELQILLNYLASGKGRNMAKGAYVAIDVRCDSESVKKYIVELKRENSDVFKNYGVDIKYAPTYGNMTSLIFSKM